MTLQFLDKTAITVVTPPVVFHSFPASIFHSFPLPVTHVSFLAVRRNHSGVTADRAIPSSYNCGLVACHGDHWRHGCGVGGSTAGPVRW